MNSLTSLLRVGTIIAVCVTAAWAWKGGVRAQDKLPTFKAGVAIVPITAVVRDRQGRLVPDLTREDFEVLENEQPRPIVEFRTTNRAPVSLAILFDTSSSMADANHMQGKAVVEALTTVLDPQSDEAALFTFDQKLRQETPFTSEAGVIREAVAKTIAWGQTSLYDAVGETATRVAERPAPRQAVIVITDGRDTSSSRSASDVSQLASSVDVPVYVFAVSPRRGFFGRGDSGLSNLARTTGGERFDSPTPEVAAKAAQALLAELRQQYFLAIESAVKPGWYSLEVRTRNRELRVRARSGYMAEAR